MSKSKKENKIPSDSIVSSEWEYLDPTPDIHALFIQFNHRFFSGRLEGVEVKWSPRMTLCAGVCSYEGRGGLCSVRLSAPLLKLRPRKDLVETLLHEMIHAFLFVTQNNRDRDGHGPEFQKHMHRINKECGCNITIYHSFHAEVKLYQQHVWRCDGPCKQRAPFFGLVRRSMNRAPGKSDNWWAQHQATCNGKFTKIQEPENYKAKVPKAIKDKKGGDIRKFVVPGTGNVNGFGSQGKIPTSTAGSSDTSGGNLKTPINTINNTNSNPQIHVTGNVRSFSDIGGGRGSNQPVGPLGRGNKVGQGGPRGGRGGGGLRGAVSNRGSGTIVVRGTKTNTQEETATTSTQPISNFIPFQGTGRVLGNPSSVPKIKTEYPNERINKPSTSQGNILGKKSYTEPSTSGRSSIIENGSSNSYINPNKKLKSDDNDKTKITKWFSPTKKQSESSVISVLDKSEDDVMLVDDTQVKCPVCNCCISVEKVNGHLDECLSRLSVGKSNTTDVIVIDEDDEDDTDDKNLVKCPLCDAYYPPDKLEAHVNSCVETLHDAFEADIQAENTCEDIKTENTCEIKSESPVPNDSTVSCPICQINVAADTINQHLDNCLSESVIKNDDFN